MDVPVLLEELTKAVSQDMDREQRAGLVAEAIRAALGERWVGIYEVRETEVAIVAWSGPGAPAHPRFPITMGLTAEAIASGTTVVSNDVSRDPRYLTAFGSTRSEMIVPVLHPETGHVIGTIDAESGRPDAFDDHSRRAVEACARIATGLFAP